ncbi:hypothetical protein N9043_00830 [bacterium]|nr:hypothetical protein [bacterium]
MYYEEKMINSKLHYRRNPNDAWIQMSVTTLSSKIKELQEENKSLQREVDKTKLY